MFIRYNQLSKYFEYDASGGLGAGPWIKLEIDYSQITNAPPGYILPANVALIDVNKTWTAVQAFLSGSQIRGPQSVLTLLDPTAAADAKYWQLLSNGGNLRFRALNDPQNVEQGFVEFGRNGTAFIPVLLVYGNSYLIGPIYERNRGVAMGEWQNKPFNASDFFVQAGTGTWTVGSAAVLQSRYTLIGKTMHWTMYVSWFSGANVIAGTVTQVGVRVPGGFISTGSASFNITRGFNGPEVDLVGSSTSNDRIAIGRRDNAALAAGALGFICSITLEVE